jgi:hypothetical protein
MKTEWWMKCKCDNRFNWCIAALQYECIIEYHFIHPNGAKSKVTINYDLYGQRFEMRKWKTESVINTDKKDSIESKLNECFHF